jgi:hypothetical protein
MLFGRLVGSWDVEIADEAGAARGRWVFGRVLQGRAVLDVLWEERTQLRGTTVRHCDGAADVWRIAWFGPEDPSFVVGEARAQGEDIVIRCTNLEYQMSWIFSDLTPETSRWRAEGAFPEGSGRAARTANAITMARLLVRRSEQSPRRPPQIRSGCIGRSLSALARRRTCQPTQRRFFGNRPWAKSFPRCDSAAATNGVSTAGRCFWPRHRRFMCLPLTAIQPQWIPRKHM